MEYIKDPSLILDLNLWEHDGSKFMSDDGYGHEYTRTGALWTPNGHYFDGVDDSGQIADNDIFSFGDGTTDSPFSLEAIVNAYDVTNKCIACKRDLGGGREWTIYYAAGIINVSLYDQSTGGYRGRKYNTALNTNQWYHIVCTYNGNTA